LRYKTNLQAVSQADFRSSIVCVRSPSPGKTAGCVDLGFAAEDVEKIDHRDIDAFVLDSFDSPLRVVSDRSLINLFASSAAKPRSRIPPSFQVKVIGRRRLMIESPPVKRLEVGLVAQRR